MDVSSILYLFSLAAGAAVVTALMIWLSLRAGYAQRMAVDLPNRRSLHARATPRIGGWALIPVAVAGAFIWARPLWPVAWIMMVFFLTWGINAYNFMDGADGLAGGMALLGFSAYAAAASSTAPDLAI